jgi:hypothetical protein
MIPISLVTQLLNTVLSILSSLGINIGAPGILG